MQRSKFSLPLLVMAAAEAAGSTGAAQVPDSTAAGAEAPKARAPKNPDNILDIVNGRLPLPLVSVVRFGAPELTGATNAEKAKALGTSVGKIFDIIKGRNFGYIDQNFKFSADEIAQAKKWLTEAKTNRTQKTIVEHVGQAKVDAIVKALDGMGVASAEDLAKRPPTRQVGQPKAGGAAPVAQSAPAAGAEAPAAGGAKMF